MQQSIPYNFPKEILQTIFLMDSKTIRNGLGVDGWPSVYEPKKDICSFCGASLSSAHPHPGQKIGDAGFLITNVVPFERITILVMFIKAAESQVWIPGFVAYHNGPSGNEHGKNVSQPQLRSHRVRIGFKGSTEFRKMF